MAAIPSLLQKKINDLKKSVSRIQTKIDTHERRKNRLLEEKTAKLDAISKLSAWEPYLQSESKLAFLFDVITQGNETEANQSKALVLAAMASFNRQETSAEELLETIEGDLFLFVAFVLYNHMLIID